MKKPLVGAAAGSKGAIITVSKGFDGAPDGLNTSTYDFFRAANEIKQITRKHNKITNF